MDLSFYIHYNGIIPEEDTTLFDIFIPYFSGALSFNTQDTDSNVFEQTMRYLKLDNRKNIIIPKNPSKYVIIRHINKLRTRNK